MFKTETEARASWCPFVRYTSGNDAHHPFNSRGVMLDPENPHEGAACLGRLCMAWRAGAPLYKYENRISAESIVNEPRETIHRGYCGLVGQGGNHE
jgi:hypothetical protein